MTKIRKAVFPVAGFGTRFLPATKAMPKELLPIVDKPLIQYAVEEAIASGVRPSMVLFASERDMKGRAERRMGAASQIAGAAIYNEYLPRPFNPFDAS